jgi:hypothetical protein
MRTNPDTFRITRYDRQHNPGIKVGIPSSKMHMIPQKEAIPTHLFSVSG